ncbi:MAG: polymer-forming cytoskeletal protein [Clostridium sp.]
MDKKDDRGDLIISGSCKVSGGNYNRVVSSGSGKIQGDLICDEFKISGSTMVDGSIDCNNEVKISGSGKICGNIKCNELRISGSSKIEGNLACNEGKISGSCKVAGGVKAKVFSISGGCAIGQEAKVEQLKVSGGCKFEENIIGKDVIIRGGVKVRQGIECENFDSEGRFMVGEMINADVVSITLEGLSNVKEIGCSKVVVQQNNSGFILKDILGMFSKSANNLLEVELIEADDVKLENTNALTVRGDKIIIGNNCKIDLVEYKDEYKCGENSIVKKVVKLNY